MFPGAAILSAGISVTSRPTVFRSMRSARASGYVELVDDASSPRHWGGYNYAEVRLWQSHWPAAR